MAARKDTDRLHDALHAARATERRTQGLPPPPPLPATPCDDCHHTARCAAEHIACQAFEVFTRYPVPARWALAPRQPNRQIHAALFPP